MSDPPPFLEIARLLCDAFVARGCRVEPATLSQSLIDHGCRRVSLRLVPTDPSDPHARRTLDLLFNSSAGYRAQYYIGARQGDQATADLLATLMRGPLAEIVRHGIEPWLGADVQRSLTSSAARVWINEEAIPNEPRADIEAQKWIEAQHSGSSRRIPAARLWTLFWGTTAPIPHYLVVLGGWLDRHGEVFLDSDKADRSERLSGFGWV